MLVLRNPPILDMKKTYTFDVKSANSFNQIFKQSVHLSSKQGCRSFSWFGDSLQSFPRCPPSASYVIFHLCFISYQIKGACSQVLVLTPNFEPPHKHTNPPHRSQNWPPAKMARYTRNSTGERVKFICFTFLSVYICILNFPQWKFWCTLPSWLLVNFKRPVPRCLRDSSNNQQ